MTDEFLKRIMEQAGSPQERTRPGWWRQDPSGCIFCFWEDVPYYAKRIGGGICLYLADDDDRTIGVQLIGEPPKKPDNEESRAKWVSRCVESLQSMLDFKWKKDPEEGSYPTDEDTFLRMAILATLNTAIHQVFAEPIRSLIVRDALAMASRLVEQYDPPKDGVEFSKEVLNRCNLALKLIQHEPERGGEE